MHPISMVLTHFLISFLKAMNLSCLMALPFLRNPSLINGFIQNGICLKGATPERDFFGQTKDVNNDMTECSASFIVENIHSQTDEDGLNTKILDSILDCRKESNAVDNSGLLFQTKS